MSSDPDSEEARQLAKDLTTKIGSQLVTALFDQSKHSTKASSGIEIHGGDGNIFVLDAGFRDQVERQASIINTANRIENEFSRFISRDILGLTIGIIGLDYVTRFNMDAEEYLITKSSKFDRKMYAPTSKYPKGKIENRIEQVLIELQKLYDGGLTLDGIRQEKVLDYIKGVAYNINRFKHLMRSGYTYVDLVKALANFHHIVVESVVNTRFRRI
jgi:hypothetical protein